MDKEQSRMTRIRQRFDDTHIEDIESAVYGKLARLDAAVRKDDRIAIAVGSRGVSNLRQVVKATVAWVRSRGGQPFISPAMGSPGGGTPQGQADVLASYGVTEEQVGAPVRSSLQVVELERKL